MHSIEPVLAVILLKVYDGWIVISISGKDDTRELFRLFVSVWTDGHEGQSTQIFKKLM